MDRIKSISDKRLIIKAEVNGKSAFFLLDSGASIALIDSDKKKEYGLKVGRKYSGTIVGAGGEMSNVRCCDTFVHFEGKPITQFLLADIGNVVRSIRKETGVEILGIISLPQMRLFGLGIDANDMEVIIE